MESDDARLPEAEGENGPPKKLSRRHKSSSSSEMEIETGGGDGLWNPGSADYPLNTSSGDGALTARERQAEQESARPVLGCTSNVTASARCSIDHDRISKSTISDHIVEGQILKLYEKHLVADCSDNVPCEENSPSAMNQFGDSLGANPCEGSKVDGSGSVGEGEDNIGLGESEWVNLESVGILDVSMTSQPDMTSPYDMTSQPDTYREKTNDSYSTCASLGPTTHEDLSVRNDGSLGPSMNDDSGTRCEDSLGPNACESSSTTHDSFGPTTHEDISARIDYRLGLSMRDISSPRHNIIIGHGTGDNSCTTRDSERPSTSAGYTPGGCNCSSELVATLALQRDHTSAICNLCSRNLDCRPVDNVMSPNSCEILGQNDSQAGKESLVGEMNSSRGALQTDFDVHLPPGGSESDQASSLQFNELPVPIILKIFGFLSRFEQLRKVALVCKFWNTLTQDPELWRVIDLRGQFKLTNRILDRLTSYSDHVTSIDLSDSKLISSSGVAALTKRCHSLQVLKLSRCYSLNGPAFHSIGENCPSLRKLYFDICYSLTDTDLRCIAQGCPRLTTLSLNHCDSITDEGVKAVARHCPQLEAINLDHLGKLTHHSLEALSCHCPKLAMVSLMSAVMNDEGILHLTQLPNLSVLDVSNITALTKKSVTRIVMRCKQLTKLNICLMRWVDDDMIEVIARNASNLKTLHCVSCNITDNGLKILADTAKHLEVLDVSWCNDLTAEGVQYIAERCRTLRFISLIRCDRVTMETLTDFVDRYPRIHFSSFFLDAQRLLKKAMEQGYV